MSTILYYDNALGGSHLKNIKGLSSTNIFLPTYAIGGDNRVATVLPSGGLATDPSRIHINWTMDPLTNAANVITPVSSDSAVINMAVKVTDKNTSTSINSLLTVNIYAQTDGTKAISSNQSLATPNATITQVNSTSITQAFTGGVVFTWGVNGNGNLTVAGSTMPSNNCVITVKGSELRL